MDDLMFLLLPWSLYQRFFPAESLARDIAYHEAHLFALKKDSSQSLYKSMLIAEVAHDLAMLKAKRA